MAELLRARRRRQGGAAHRQQPRDGQDRGRLCALRLASWTRVRRRTGPDRAALLHQLDLTGSRPVGRRAPGELNPLHTRFPSLRGALPHLELGRRPSPVRRLAALEQEGGDGELWLKDDGVFGHAWGGNKARKLEWILPDVRRRGRRTIVTVGATGTNHGLATALYAREIGIRTALV